jgi:hypothetical protein
LRNWLQYAQPLRWEQKILLIGFAAEWSTFRDLVDVPETHDLLATKLQELGAPGTQVKFVVEERASGTATPGPPSGPPAGSAAQAGAAVLAGAPQGAPETQPAGRPRGTRTKSAASSPPTPPEPVRVEDFKNDPLIQQALEMFKARLVSPGR